MRTSRIQIPWRDEQPTRLFIWYFMQLILRTMLFFLSIVLYVLYPDQLDITTNLGPRHWLDFVDVVFVLMAIDLATKFMPHAKIAMGSRKQYGEFHVPTGRLFEGGIRELREHAKQLLLQAPALLQQAPSLLQQAPSLLEKTAEEARQAMRETAQGMLEFAEQLVYSIDVLRLLPWPEEDLTASERLRDSIRRHRLHEIIPVIIFWMVFNVALGLLIERFHVYNERTALIWTLFYFDFDMICVVLWCPLQLALMRNRCCTTCQIFNWDGIMTVTPLLVVPCWFSILLILQALAVLTRWELAFIRHPERFDERTNASLLCVNCKDKLCYLRKPFTPRTRS